MAATKGPKLKVASFSFSSQDNTNIDAAIRCLVKSIMSLEEEIATTDAAASRESDSGFLVLPRFDRGAKERGLGGCSGCASLKPRR